MAHAPASCIHSPAVPPLQHLPILPQSRLALLASIPHSYSAYPLGPKLAHLLFHSPITDPTCTGTLVTSTPLLPQLPHTDTRAPRVPSPPPQIPTRTGPRSQTLPSVGGYRTALPSVCPPAPHPRTSLVPNPPPGNYRKKLKKRLEDLERRAASSSASPEQKPAELQPTQPSARQAFPSPASSESDFSSRRTPEMQVQGYEERGMFSHQYTDRQLSTSPPPFSYSAYPTPESAAYPVPYTTTAPYHSIPTTISPEMTTYAYLPPLSAPYSTTLPSLAPPMKSEYYQEDEIANPFASGYQLMNSMEIPPPHAYPPSDAHVKLPSRKPYSYAH